MNRVFTNLGNVDLSTSNHGTSQRGTQEIDIFVDGIASNSREAKLLHKFPCIVCVRTIGLDKLRERGTISHTTKVHNFTLDCTALQCFFSDSVKVLCISL